MNGYTNQDVYYQVDEDIKVKQKNLYYGIDVNEAKEEEPDNIIINEWIATKLADGYDLNMNIPGDIIADNNNTDSEEESDSSKIEDNEEVLYNSEESEIENESDNESDLLSNIKELASRDNELMVDRSMELYKLEYGEYPSLELLEKGLYNVGRSLLNGIDKKESENKLNSESESDILYENESVMTFSDELENALLIASKIGIIDQEYLANKVLNTYYEVNQKEASLDELSNIFKNVKSELQYEAMDDILEIGSDDESDDEYYVTKNDIIQAVLDELDSEEEEQENESDYDNEIENGDSEDVEDDSSYDPTNDLQDYSADYELYA